MEVEATKAIFRNLCPICGGNIESSRLEMRLPCSKCLPKIEDERELYRKAKSYKLLSREEELYKLESMFEKYVGSPMWGLQRLWARRFLDGESFAMVAPTGSGKTTVQIIMALYAASKGKRSLILLPTSLLANQVQEKVLKAREILGLNVEVKAYHSYLTGKEKERELEAMEEAKIIITTSTSLLKREEISRQKIDIAFVDDVDSFLRKSKSIDYVLEMLGVTGEVIDSINESLELEKKAREVGKRDPEEAKNLLRRAEEIKRKAREKVVAQVIVSGATQSARRTKRVRMLNSILGFTVGGRVEVGRKVIDSYYNPPEGMSLEDAVASIISKLGTGGLIFVPLDKGLEYVKRLEEALRSRGLNVKAFTGTGKRAFKQFVNGEVDCLIGIVSYRSPLTRGIDLPERVRYAVFAGVPKFRIKIITSEFHPTRWLILLSNIRESIPKIYEREIDFIMGGLANLRTLTTTQLETVRKALVEGIELEGFLGYAKRVAERTMKLFNEVLSNPEVLKALKESPSISFSDREGEYHFLVPDTTAYIQASGRTSRFYAGGITRGLSVVVVDEVKAFNGLVKESKWFLEEVDWKDFEKLPLEDIVREIDEDRLRVRLSIEGKLREEAQGLVKTRLFVVESPNKAKTISRLFGRPTRRVVEGLQTFEVLTGDSLMVIAATGGHILDLDLNEGLFGVYVEEGKFIPIYKPIRKCISCGREVPEEEEECPSCKGRTFSEAKPIIEGLRKLASQVDEVLIGTDPDSEGEKIAWDVYLTVKPYNKNVWRVRFHEVTRRGLLEALSKLDKINSNMVESQIVRRIEDRWIGFSISPILWKKFNLKFLSAGRVQTPVLGWVVDRTLNSRDKAELIDIILENGLRIVFKAEKGTFKKLIENGYVEILDVKREIVEQNPPPPYTTDSMLAEASRVLRADAGRVMAYAQRLFESGLITYHRTDSTTVSSVGIGLAREYISSVFTEDLFKPRKWEKPGAHECIRPTRPIDSKRLKALLVAKLIRLPIPLRDEEIRLYDLIFRRFIASQMMPAKIEKTIIKVGLPGAVQEFVLATRILEEGYTKMLPFKTVDVEKLEVGRYKILVEESSRRLVPIQPLYTYSDLVTMMKDRGIGRPSTYAKILDTLRRRGYILEVARSKIVATKRGIEVYKFLNENYGRFLSEETTRNLQKLIDEIEEGKTSSQAILREFYHEVTEIISTAILEGVAYPSFGRSSR